MGSLRVLMLSLFFAAISLYPQASYSLQLPRQMNSGLLFGNSPAKQPLVFLPDPPALARHLWLFPVER